MLGLEVRVPGVVAQFTMSYVCGAVVTVVDVIILTGPLFVFFFFLIVAANTLLVE